MLKGLALTGVATSLRKLIFAKEPRRFCFLFLNPLSCSAAPTDGAECQLRKLRCKQTHRR
jgi:hypothetical protein